MSLPALAEAAGLTDDELRDIEQGTATMTPRKALPEPQSPSSAAAARAAAAAATVAAAETASHEVPREAAAKLSKWLQAQADVLAPATGGQAWLGRQARAVLAPPQPLPAATLRAAQQQAAETRGPDEAVSRGQSPQPQGTDAGDGTEDPLAGAGNSYQDWQHLLMQVRSSWASFLRLMAMQSMPCTGIGSSSACLSTALHASGPPSQHPTQHDLAADFGAWHHGSRWASAGNICPRSLSSSHPVLEGVFKTRVLCRTGQMRPAQQQKRPSRTPTCTPTRSCC